jgi:hypothetical protein
MFPPCSLGLRRAVTNQARYVRSNDNWMLGAFVLAIDQFDAVKDFLSQFDRLHLLRVSALAPKSENATSFAKVLVTLTEAIRSLSTCNRDLVAISQLEMFLPEDIDPALLLEARSVLGDLPVFWETPAARAEQTIALIAEHNSTAPKPTFGFKLRTGGVTADAFPISAQIAKTLVAADKHQVPIKFTAGLHHPLRMYRDEVKTKMHGFLNVLGAAVLAGEHGWDEKQTAAMLDDENTESFSFGEQSFAWRDWKIDIKRLKDRRKFVTTFGSCSFDEPREDLRALGLL